jgi:hypothetical protein
VPAIATLQKSFRERSWRLPFNASPVIEEEGLVLGHGTVLARMGTAHSGVHELMLQADEARLLALLSAVYGGQVSPRVMHHVKRASDQWTRGDKALAHIELAFAQLPRLETTEDSFRLFLAEDLLDKGLTPEELTRALGFDAALLKFDPNQPPQSAGHGRESGRWIRVGDDGAEQTGSPSAKPQRAFLAPDGKTLIETTERAAIDWLADFAGTLIPEAAGAVVLAGFLVVPTLNSGGVEEGDVPKLPGVRYKISRPTGQLTITATADDGDQVSIAAHLRGFNGIYYDADGRAIGRDVGTGLYIDLDAADAGLRAKLGVAPKDSSDSDTGPFNRSDEPKLCPDPSQDRGKKKLTGEEEKVPRDERDFDKLYQEYVGSVVNPQLKPPLPAELGYALWNPIANKLVVFDHCQLTTGIMIDAKGHYENLLKYDWGWESLTSEFLRQAESQIEAADANGGRPIEWHFYEKETMEFAREIFKENGLIPKIQLVYTDYPGNREWPYPKKVRNTWAKGRQKL